MPKGSRLLRWLLLLCATSALSGCVTFASAMGAGIGTAIADQAVATACNDAEAALVEAMERRQWNEARGQLQRMRSTCEPHRYRAAQQYLDEMNPPAPQPPAAPQRTGPNLFPACLAHVEGTGLPPWDRGFRAAIQANICNAEDLDDAVVVVRHKLEQRCRETTAAMHTRVSLGDVDGARTLVAGAQQHCTPEQREVMTRALEAASRAPPPN